MTQPIDYPVIPETELTDEEFYTLVEYYYPTERDLRRIELEIELSILHCGGGDVSAD